MNPLQNFAYGDNLVRMVEKDGEPWFVGKDICECLDLKNHRTTLDLLDEDEKGVHSMDTLGGDQDMIVVSEAGIYRLVFRSRKPEAEKFKRWLAHEVIPAIRKTGQYGSAERWSPQIDQDAPLMARVEAVKTAMRLGGKAYGREIWAKMGLPPMPDMAPLPPDRAAEDCLRHLLEHQPGRQTLRQMIAEASAGRFDADLRPYGIRLSGDGDGFVVASSHPELREIYAGSRWHGGGWAQSLRQLSGASTVGTMKYGRNIPGSRGTFIPFGWVWAPETPKV